MTENDEWAPVDEEWEAVEGPQEAAGAPAPKTIGEYVTQKAGPLGNAAIGYIKEAGKLGQGAGKLVNSGTAALADMFGRQAWAPGAKGGVSDAILPGSMDQNLPELEADNTAQAVGAGAGKVAQFLASGGGGVAANALKSGAVAAAQSGNVGSEALMAALASAVTGGAGKALGAAGKAVGESAQLRALAEVLGKGGIGAKEVAGGAVGAYQGRGGGVKGMAGGAVSGAGLSKMLMTPAGQKLLAKALERMATLGRLAPLAGAGGAALGKPTDDPEEYRLYAER